MTDIDRRTDFSLFLKKQGISYGLGDPHGDKDNLLRIYFNTKDGSVSVIFSTEIIVGCIAESQGLYKNDDEEEIVRWQTIQELKDCVLETNTINCNIVQVTKSY
jgi:hypothetical protein